MHIERNKYLKQLISLLNNKMIKIISGIRRCGKSFLLFEIFYSYLKSNVAKDESHIIKLAFDILKTGHLRNPLVLSKYINEKNYWWWYLLYFAWWDAKCIKFWNVTKWTFKN